MRTSNQGRALIRMFESFSATPYRCPAGAWTIGFGCVIGNDEVAYYQKHPVSKRQAIELFDSRIETFEDGLAELIKVPVKQHQWDALVSLVFNIGVYAFGNSTLLRRLNKADYADAAKEFSRWVYSNGRVLRGLVRRRTREQILFATGEYGNIST